jgi:probable LLM family oxidoreductase
VEIGVYTFAELRGETTPEQRLRDLMEEVEVAEAVGLDVFGVGEHHRPDFAVSAPAVVLAAAAARTSRIRLTSAVTVLSSDDPIRVFQEFSEVDLLSGGRAEIMAGRGSFIESFPLFGYDLRDYDELFVEKLERLLAIRAGAVPGVHPRPVQQPLPVWVAVGGNPESAVRAGSLGLPMALAIIGGQPERFVPFADVHREAAQAAGHGRQALSINSHGYVGNPDEFFPGYAEMMTTIGRERGWPPMQRQDFDALRTRRGALVVGSTQEVVEKILFQHELFGHDRFLMQTSVGSLPHAQVLRSIERLGTEVVPAVRAALKD